MESKSGLISSYPASVNLRHLAATFSEKQKDLKFKEREYIYSALNKEFYEIKEKPLYKHVENLAEYFPVSRCNSCFRNQEENHKTENYDVNMLDIHQLFYLRNEKYLKYLRLLFSKCESNIDSSEKLLKNEELDEFVKELKLQYENVYMQNKIFKWCKKSINSFRSKFSSVIFRLFGFCLYLKSFKFLQKLIISSAELELIKNCKNENLPIIYLLNNRNLFDHIFISFVLYFNGLKPPVIVYKHNRRPALKWIFQKLGVLFIQLPTNENTVKHIIHHEVLQIFIDENVKHKNHLLFCLESLPIKIEKDTNLILRTVVASLKRNSDQDILFVPVNIDYERINADFSVIEPFENSSKKISVWFYLCNIYRRFKFNLGFARISFGYPFFLKEMVTVNEENNFKTISWDNPNFDSYVDSLTYKIALHMAYDFSKSRVLMSTNLICFLLLKKFRTGVKFNEIVKEVDQLRSELNKSKKRMAFTGESKNIVNHVLELLGPRLIHVKTDAEWVIQPVLMLPNVLELSYYSNKVIDHFIWDGIILTCIFVIFKNDLEEAFKSNENTLKFSYHYFVEKVQDLCDILQFEFILEKPCQSRSFLINDAFFKFVTDDVFVKNEKLLTEQEKWGHKYAQLLEYSDSEDSEENYYNGTPKQVNDSENSYTVNFRGEIPVYKQTLFYKNALKPIIDGYVASAENLITLVGKEILDVEYFNKLLNTMQKLLKENKLKFPESVSLNIIRNSMKLFEKWGVIQKNSFNGVKTLHLSENYNTEEQLLHIIDKIKFFS